MSLNSRINQIATNVIQGYLAQQSTLTQNNINNANSNQITAQITALNGDGTWTVQFADFTTQIVSPGGLNVVGVGDTVLVSNGIVIG